MITQLCCPNHFGFIKARPQLLSFDLANGTHVLECQNNCGYWTIVSDDTLTRLAADAQAA